MKRQRTATSATTPVGNLLQNAYRVAVPMDHVTRLCYLTSMHPLASSLNNTLSRTIIAGGIDVYLKSGEKRIEMADEYKRVFDREWLNKLVPQMEFYFNAVGFAVVNFIQSQLLSGELVPNVMLPSQFLAFFTDIPGQPRQWLIYARQRVGAFGGGGVSIPGISDPLDNVLVFERDAPLYNGELTSPMARIAERLSLLEEMYQNLGYADYWRTRQPWPTRPVPSKDNPDPLDDDHYAEGDVTGEMTKYRRKQQQERSQLFDVAVNQAQARNQKVNDGSFDVVNDTASRYGPNRHSAYPPYLHNFEVPEGQELVKGPLPEVLPNMIAVIQQIEAEVCNAFGMPPSMVLENRAQFADRVKTSQRLMNQTVQYRQAFFDTVLEQLYTVLYRNSHEDFVVGQLNKRTKQKSVGGEIEPGDSREDVEPELLQPEDIVDFLARKVHVHVELRRHAFAELKDIAFLVQNNWISEQDGADTAVSIVGMPVSKALDEDERKEEENVKFNRKKREAEIGVKPKPPGGGGGGFAFGK